MRCRKDGSLVDISLTVSPLRNAAGKITGVAKIARDISARKKVEHERLLALQDEDRRHIANELHDSTAQHLAAISLNLMRVRADAEVKAETRDVLDEIGGSLEEATKRSCAPLAISFTRQTCKGRAWQSRSGDMLRVSVGGLD